ncbi:hypothetical protein niasHT_031393 [Heterodera trifolii]|uniref:Uncharacterized protein n=1 Tax=Heterodera trifolii TaxID=157864 RepID=A0ABD2J1N7_9BILA
MDTTTINRILAANAKTRELYLGCFPCDKLPNIINKYPSALVANNDPSNKEGTHWVAMFIVDDRPSTILTVLDEHRICLRYPNNPCVIEKSMNGNERFYPLELVKSCPSDQQLVLSIVTSGCSNDHKRAFKWTLRALEWHTRALKWHTRGRSGGMVSLPFPKGDDS